MSQPINSQSEDSRQPSSAESPGRQLRALRESRKLDIERIAAQLHLQRHVIEALEDDQFDRLPDRVFVIGYLHNYARLLGADPAPITAAYRAMVPAEDTQLVRSAGQSGEHTHSAGHRWAWLIGLVLIGSAGLVGLFWWQANTDQAASPPLAESTDTTREPSEPEPVSASATGAAPQDERARPTDAPIDSFGSVASVPVEAIPLRQPATPLDPTAPSPAQTPETPPVAAIAPAEPEEEPEPEPAAVSGKEIALEFTGTSWVDVRGADGRVVLNGEMRSGDRRVLTGEPPFKLVIGNVAATRMTVGGQIFDLKGRSQGNVARFSLDPNVSQ